MDLSINSAGQSFKNRVIDMHTHIGTWQGRRYSVDDVVGLNNGLQGYSVDTFIMSNTDCFELNENPKPRKNELDGNRDILKATQNHKNTKVLLVGDPDNGNVENLEKVYKEAPDKIVGIKFHPETSRLSATSEKYEKYMQFANDKKLPVLFHSGVDFSTETLTPSDPRSIYGLAKKFPDVPVILGHTGAGNEKAHEVAIDTIVQSVEKKDAKLYADISWMNWKDGLPSDEKPSVISLVQRLKEKGKTDRILFGTDSPLGCYGEKPVKGVSPVSAYQKTIDSLNNALKKHFPTDWKQLSEDILYNNAKKLFLEKKENLTNSVANTAKKIIFSPKMKKVAAASAGVFAALGVALKLSYEKK